MFVMVFVVENIRITVMVSIVFFRRVDFNSIYFILKLLRFRVNSCSFLQRTTLIQRSKRSHNAL